ncbi:MAG: hypothetical protein HXY30_13300 [Pseudorhodoplanes sp.]|nr:hypothetical protein [Pseudorhodoplanes sp.]
MGRANTAHLAFNRGEVAKAALARVDQERLQLSAERQANWLPLTLGPMTLRPGWQYCGGIRSDLAPGFIPFVFSNSDLALIEATDGAMRVWLVDEEGESLVERAAVTAQIQNGDFWNAAGWTLSTSGAGASATIGAGELKLASPASGGLAKAHQSFAIGPGDLDTEHAFRIVVARGPVRFRAGSAESLDDIVAETTLETGVHSLAFTPGVAIVHLELETITAQTKIVTSVAIEGEGALEIPTSWAEADLRYLRHAQSGDVIFVACRGQQQRRIERRSATSWSFVLYKSDDGPFGGANGSDITITPGALSGNTTLTASRALFRPSHVGALFRLFSSGQTASASIAAENTFSSAIRVTGVGAGRIFTLTIAGTWSGTLTLQRSLDGDSSVFVDVFSRTGNTSETYNDELDNSVAWYRIGFKTGNYASGTAVVSLTYVGGGGAGIARVTGYNSRTSVEVEVLQPFSSLTATAEWNEGDWSDRLGWPSSVRFYDGRLWWAGRDRIWGSVSDAYNSFDMDYEGDAAPINRSVGFGPVDNILWLLDLSRLIVGREGAETSVRSGSFDEPLTPTNFTLKDCSTQGSANVPAVKIDTRGVFVEKSGRRVYELAFNVEAQDYVPYDLTRLNPDIGKIGFTGLDVQRQPDTMLHFPRTDGVVATLLREAGETAEAWWRAETDGAVEAVCVLPGLLENRVYFGVARTIGGVTKRFLERAARRDQCSGRPEARLMDSHILYTGGTTTVPVPHLAGREVVAWGWDDDATEGSDCGTGLDDAGNLITLTADANGDVTIPESFDNVCVGLPYRAEFKSAKLAYAASRGTALNQKKKIDKLGLILIDTHYQGVRFGNSFTRMDNLPLSKDGQTIAVGTVHEDYDLPQITAPGGYTTDSRLCLLACSPRPATVMAATLDITTHDSP